MFSYVTHLVRQHSDGDEWQVWIGTAPSEEAATAYIYGLLLALNTAVVGDNKWEMQNMGELDLATALAYGQVMVSTSFYRNEQRPVINMVQATGEEADAFSQESDIDPEGILEDDELWSWDDWYLDDTCLGS